MRLKSCPHCGVRPNYYSYNDGFLNYCSIYCSSCGAGFQGHEKKNEVAEAWNRRATEEPKVVIDAHMLSTVIVECGKSKKVAQHIANALLETSNQWLRISK